MTLSGHGYLGYILLVSESFYQSICNRSCRTLHAKWPHGQWEAATEENDAFLAPLFLPAVTAMGVDPIHFGVIMVVNLAIGMVTPPFVLNLYIAAGIGKMTVSQVTRVVFPFIVIFIATLLVITFAPELSLLILG